MTLAIIVDGFLTETFDAVEDHGVTRRDYIMAYAAFHHISPKGVTIMKVTD